jgi:hypothetical protein
MNYFILKNCILIAGILGTTAMAAGPVGQMVLGGSQDPGGGMTAESVYRFGSGVFYQEIGKPGNEYMQSSVEGYSKTLIQDEGDTAGFNARWQEGVATFRAGYADCNDAYLMLATVPYATDEAGKNAPWKRMRAGREGIARSEQLFTAAKSHASAGSSLGFTIGMVLPRIEAMKSEAGEAELASIQATLADRNHDTAGFHEHLKETGDAIREMKRLYPELRVLSHDF